MSVNAMKMIGQEKEPTLRSQEICCERGMEREKKLYIGVITYFISELAGILFHLKGYFQIIPKAPN
jgi:hypothetical protein